jgi:hypothetical protein
MTEQHPITPPDELVWKWHLEWFQLKVKHIGINEYMAAQGAKWGADQQLNEDCKWLHSQSLIGGAVELRAYMRPEPPSLKELALELVRRIEGAESAWALSELNIVRRALEALPND